MVSVVLDRFCGSRAEIQQSRFGVNEHEDTNSRLLRPGSLLFLKTAMANLICGFIPTGVKMSCEVPHSLVSLNFFSIQ